MIVSLINKLLNCKKIRFKTDATSNYFNNYPAPSPTDSVRVSILEGTVAKFEEHIAETGLDVIVGTSKPTDKCSVTVGKDPYWTFIVDIDCIEPYTNSEPLTPLDEALKGADVRAEHAFIFRFDDG